MEVVILFHNLFTILSYIYFCEMSVYSLSLILQFLGLIFLISCTNQAAGVFAVLDQMGFASLQLAESSNIQTCTHTRTHACMCAHTHKWL